MSRRRPALLLQIEATFDCKADCRRAAPLHAPRLICSRVETSLARALAEGCDLWHARACGHLQLCCRLASLELAASQASHAGRSSAAAWKSFAHARQKNKKTFSRRSHDCFRWACRRCFLLPRSAPRMFTTMRPVGTFLLCRRCHLRTCARARARAL